MSDFHKAATASATTDASALTAGTLADARLSTNVTVQGNTFNAASKLVQLDASTKLPAVDGSQLTNVPAPATINRTVSIGNSGYFTNNATNGFRINNSTDVRNLVIIEDDGTGVIFGESVNVGSVATARHTLDVRGSFGNAIASTSSDATLGISHHTLVVDASGAARTITLPTAVGIAGRIYAIKKTDSSANTVTIATTSSQTIDGATTKVISNRYSVICVQSDGANWQIIAGHAAATSY